MVMIKTQLINHKINKHIRYLQKKKKFNYLTNNVIIVLFKIKKIVNLSSQLMIFQ